MIDSPGTRLGRLAEKGGLSARELDRLAGRPENQAALIIKRAQRSIRDDIARSYATVCGVSLGYLLGGDGAEPTDAEVQAAVASARARAGTSPAPEPASARRTREVTATRPGTAKARGSTGKRRVASGEN